VFAVKLQGLKDGMCLNKDGMKQIKHPTIRAVPGVTQLNRAVLFRPFYSFVINSAN